MNKKAIHLAFSNIKNKLAETVYLHTAIDATRPIQIYGLINTRCNARCPMCDYWRLDNHEEIPAAYWIDMLKSLKRFSKSFHINFSGGEPLLKRDFFDILKCCQDLNVSAGFTTNGLLLNKTNIKFLLEDLQLLNINISLDSIKAEIHNQMRGLKEGFSRIKNNIELLVKTKDEIGSPTQIIIKPTVCKLNINNLDGLVDFAKSMGIYVNFQPIYKHSCNVEHSCNIDQLFDIDTDSLDQAIKKLIDKKEKNAPILNSTTALNQWRAHFLGTDLQRNTHCVVGLRNLFVRSNGDVSLCGFCESTIGNIYKNSNIGELWLNTRAKKLRKDLINCRRLCTATSVVKRDWKDYYQLFCKFN